MRNEVLTTAEQVFGFSSLRWKRTEGPFLQATHLQDLTMQVNVIPIIANDACSPRI